MRAQPGRALVSCAALFALFTTCATQAQTPPVPAPTGDLRGDLKIFRSQVVEADVAYSPTSRAEARARLDARQAAGLNGYCAAVAQRMASQIGAKTGRMGTGEVPSRLSDLR